MAGVNKVILIGHLGQDPEVKHLDGGAVVAKFSLATSESYKNKQGEKVETTEWHQIEVWEGQAKVAEQYLKKGSQLYVEGKIKTDSWTTESGEKRYSTKIRCLSFTMLGGGSSSNTEGAPHQEYNTNKPPQASANVAEEDNDLPF